MYFLSCISVRLVLFCKRYRDMVKEGLMKKLLVLSLVFACMTGKCTSFGRFSSDDGSRKADPVG